MDGFLTRVRRCRGSLAMEDAETSVVSVARAAVSVRRELERSML